MSVHSPAAADVAALADQCVMCGLCLPQCPTYRVARTEAESPRGRIALAKGLATGVLVPSATALAHLDQCLSCLSCQTVCPSHVRYEEILVATRTAQPRPRRHRVIAWLAGRPRLLGSLARVGRALAVSRWAPQMFVSGSALGRLAAELPRVPPAPRFSDSPACPATSRGRIGLFLGCVASAFDRDTHAAAKRLLEALGFEVVTSAPGDCCGALARHAGDVDGAARLSAPVRQTFGDAKVDTVIVTASGCYGDLRDHALAGSGVRVREIGEFLAADEGFAALRFRALPRRAAVHLPCSLVNVARSGRHVTALLRRIPQLDVAPLPDQPRCCGAAGSYFLEHPHVADALRAERVEQIDDAAPDVVVTANVGCRMFLDNALRRGARPVRVVHAATLLAEQLDG